MTATHSSFMKGFSESYLADLGRIIAAWSHVELSFHLLYLSLVVMRGASSGKLNTERVRKLMGLSLDRQIAEFKKRLLEIDIPVATRSKIATILDQVSTLRGERDHVAHSQWTPIFSDAGLMPVKAASIFKSWKNSKPYNHKIVGQERLQDIFQRIETLYWELTDIALDLQLRAQKPLTS